VTTEIVVHPDATVLAAAAAARLITALADLQAAGRVPSVVVTGGGAGTELLVQTAASPARGAVDWSKVDVFWGDDRFVPADDAERNEKGAREALLDVVGFDPARIHAMAPAGGEFGDDVDAAAAAYAAVIDGHTGFDILMLGMGPEGHVASVFPDSPAVHDTGHSVVAVRDCPKPPPTRISLTLPTIRTAREVWMIVAGEGKAEAVASAIGGASEVDVPAAGAVGTEVTRWLLDVGAASRLP
jgi:6-phosphogluconolactonase